MIVSVIELVDRLVVAICEYCRLRIVVVCNGSSVFLRLFLLCLIQHVAKFFGNGVEVGLLLERACASFAMATAAGIGR